MDKSRKYGYHNTGYSKEFKAAAITCYKEVRSLRKAAQIMGVSKNTMELWASRSRRDEIRNPDLYSIVMRSLASVRRRLDMGRNNGLYSDSRRLATDSADKRPPRTRGS